MRRNALKNIRILLAAVSVAAVMLSAGCSEKKSTENKVIYYDKDNSYSQEVEGYENSEGDIVKKEELIQNVPTTPAEVGADAQISGVDVKLTNIYNAGLLNAADGVIKFDRDALVFVCEITNNTDQEMEVTAFDWSVQVLDGEYTKIIPGIDAIMLAEEKMSDMESLNQTLKPGETCTGYAAIGVYSEWQSITLYYKPAESQSNASLSFDITKDMVEEL